MLTVLCLWFYYVFFIFHHLICLIFVFVFVFLFFLWTLGRLARELKEIQIKNQMKNDCANLFANFALAQKTGCSTLWLIRKWFCCNSSSLEESLFWRQRICWGQTALVHVCCYQQDWDTSFLRLTMVVSLPAVGICKERGERSIRGIRSAQLGSLICTGNTEHGNPPGSQS